MTARIYVEGCVADKPQILETRGGKPWAKILLEEEGVRERQQQGSSNILPVTLFGRAAERAADLQRGDRLTVACRLQGTKFETDSGETRYGLQLVGEQVFIADAVKEVIR
jgi:single-stranded DNA-binding protein